MGHEVCWVHMCRTIQRLISIKTYVMSNKAQEILIPPEGVFRVTFLYVGQGDSTLLTIPDGENFVFLGAALLLSKIYQKFL